MFVRAGQGDPCIFKKGVGTTDRITYAVLGISIHSNDFCVKTRLQETRTNLPMGPLKHPFEHRKGGKIEAFYCAKKHKNRKNRILLLRHD